MTAVDNAIHWSQRGACRSEDPELFHIGDNTHATVGVYNAALAVCARCTVTTQCLQWALDNQTPSADHGVWGGTTPDDRAHLRKCGDPGCMHDVHADRRRQPVESECPGSRHGTIWAYRDAGCRCPDVVDAWFTYRRSVEARWRAKNRYTTGESRGPRPLVGYDQHKVDMAVDGRQVVLSVPEMRAAVAHLLKAGLTGRLVAERLRVNPRTVDRYRAELRQRRWQP